jgi:hypothetical protein
VVKPEETDMALDIPDELIDWRAKGFWLPDGAVGARDFAAARHTLFDGSFTWPLLVVRDSAVRANIATMAAYAPPRTPRRRWPRACWTPSSRPGRGR